jgi:uncharacterized membrane protein YoaK (UPF0700 family)
MPAAVWIQATAMTQATTAKPRAAEMPETVLTPTLVSFRRNLRKTAKNTKKQSENHPFLSDKFQLV